MADELYTVKPDGGGDYTVLQTADDAQDGDISARGIITFECYDGTADVGTANVSGWSGLDSTHYVHVFVPLAERHDGTTGSAGAWLNNSSGFANGLTITADFTRITGLRIMHSAAVGVGLTHASAAKNTLIDSCLIVSTEFVALLIPSVTGGTDYARNNIIFMSSSATIGINVTTSGGGTVLLQNNTVNGGSVSTYGIRMEGIAAVTLENNVCTNNGTDFSSDGSPTITGNNNCSEDATANDWDGSGSIVSQTPSALFVTEGSDHTLKAGSNAIDAGKDLSGTFTNDAINASGYRPQGSAFDMGALELLVVNSSSSSQSSLNSSSSSVSSVSSDSSSSVSSASSASSSLNSSSSSRSSASTSSASSGAESTSSPSTQKGGESTSSESSDSRCA